MKQEELEREQIAFNELYKTVLRNGKLMFAGRLLQRAVQQHGDTVALIFQDKHIFLVLMSYKHIPQLNL